MRTSVCVDAETQRSPKMAFCRSFVRSSALSSSVKWKLGGRFSDFGTKTQCLTFRRELSFKISGLGVDSERESDCQRDNMLLASARDKRKVELEGATLAGRYGRQVVRSEPLYEEGEGNQKDKERERLGHLFIPASLLAFSLFSKKKDEVQEAMDKLKDVDEVEMYLRHAKLAEGKREWAKADQFYHKALALLNARKQQKIWDETRVLQSQVYIYDNMANLALSRGRLKEAELLYKETVKGLLNSGREKNDNAIVEISLKLAMIYAMQQRDQEAEAGYKFCMSTQDSKISAMDSIDDDTLALYGMCINSYSRFLIIHDRLQEAEGAIKETIDIAKKALKNDHEQVAVLYSDLATVASMQKKHNSAKKYIETAISIGEKTHSPDLATFLCNKGLICLEMNEFTVAEKCCTQALKLAKERKDSETENEAELCLKDIKEKQNKA